MRIKLSSYVEPDRANAMMVELGDLVVWFSYKTAIAFNHPSTGCLVTKNIWGVTTGKHLNEIDGGDKQAKSERIGYKEFTDKLAAVLDLYKPERAS